ncbi:MAG: hypothetical protein HKN68_02915 [Saprospiraceae bacterium]|nr:hypothetical protein [Saprospiraceae bacterium]
MKLKTLFNLTLIMSFLCPLFIIAQGTCYPTNPTEVLKTIDQGTLYMDSYDEMPTFYLDYETLVPTVGTFYDPENSNIITYDNITHPVIEIENVVKRTLSVFHASREPLH